MSLKKIVTRQYRERVNQAVSHCNGFPHAPPEGWLKSVRKALGMSGKELAIRLGVTKSRVSRAEQDETTGSVTLKTMQNMAEAMDCRFVYAVIPKQEVEKMIREQALAKARRQVQKVSVQMALEAQSLSEMQLALETERLAVEMMEKMPTNFWSEE
jgi:predicted DNA-binding mobile mystery protein A